jgi:acetyl-CoA synthetase
MNKTNSNKTFKTNNNFIKNANISKDEYTNQYNQSIKDPETFWAKMGKRLQWMKPYTKIKNVSYKKEDLHIAWYEDGYLNASVNCIDRHLKTKADDIALIYEADEPNKVKKVTFQELHDEVCIFANVLKSKGVKKANRVTIYMPMCLEAVYAMLACSRIGAVHSVIFGGFSASSISQRLIDCDSHIIITANQSTRGGVVVPLKQTVDKALEDKEVKVDTVLVIKHTNVDVEMKENRDYYYEVEAQKEKPFCEPEMMNAEDPLFILYTSGSTGKPKGVLHTTGGYLVYASLTHELVFDYKDGDVYWCTADVGWITGHSYIVYGPLCNGATTVIFEGMPTYPNPSRFWEICQTHKVNIFYTAPTAIRTLMKLGDSHVQNYDLSSLRVLGSVGEPINPKAWLWYYKIIGKEKCPIVDTWWQTETGGVMLSPLPGVHELKPGAASSPFLGIKPLLLNEDSSYNTKKGDLCIKESWPGQMRTLYGNHERFYETYFKKHQNHYFSGDACSMDEDGYLFIEGRVDDVMNISGHRIATAEVESAIVGNINVAEAAVVSYSEEIKGEAIYAYITLMSDIKESDELKKEIKLWVKDTIGAHVNISIIQFCPTLPRTRSGKIMRRILRKIASSEYTELGDISTLANSTVVEDIINDHKELVLK